MPHEPAGTSETVPIVVTIVEVGFRVRIIPSCSTLRSLIAFSLNRKSLTKFHFMTPSLCAADQGSFQRLDSLRFVLG
jgi:hypothetical protein